LGKTRRRRSNESEEEGSLAPEEDEQAQVEGVDDQDKEVDEDEQAAGNGEAPAERKQAAGGQAAEEATVAEDDEGTFDDEAVPVPQVTARNHALIYVLFILAMNSAGKILSFHCCKNSCNDSFSCTILQEILQYNLLMFVLLFVGWRSRSPQMLAGLLDDKSSTDTNGLQRLLGSHSRGCQAGLQGFYIRRRLGVAG
jgi:hypothetical protein